MKPEAQPELPQDLRLYEGAQSQMQLRKSEQSCVFWLCLSDCWCSLHICSTPGRSYLSVLPVWHVGGCDLSVQTHFILVILCHL